MTTAIIKAVAPRNFRRHISRLGFIPKQFEAPAVSALAALEACWGAALVLDLASAVLLPLSILLLVGFSAMTYWGVRSGKTEDCGCYGGFIEPSIEQSLALNGMFAVLVALPWLGTFDPFSLPAWRVAVAGIALALTGLTAYATQRYEAKNFKPFFDTNPLKVGRVWRHSWAGGATRGLPDSFIVSLLGTECPFCKQWVRVANAIDQSPTLPPVVGVLTEKGEMLDEFVRKHGVRFPVGTISESLMGRMVEVVPTTIMVESGRIKEIWAGAAPPDFTRRFITAFFPGTANAFTTSTAVEPTTQNV